MIQKITSRITDFFSGAPTFKKWIPGIAWFFILLLLLCIPGQDLPKSGGWWEYIFFDKWVHIGLFALLAFLFMAPVYTLSYPVAIRRLWMIVIATCVSAWGLATEFIQHYLISGRSFDKYDWLADSFGAILAIFITISLLKKVRPKNNV